MQFIILVLLGLIFIIYNLYINYEDNSTSELVQSTYELKRLYNSSSDYYFSFNLDNGDSATIIGNIIIDKINVNYPILSNLTDELLKISICKFYGPNPNSVGNMCLAGHNYNDSRFFSRLNELKIGDSIRIINHNRF